MNGLLRNRKIVVTRDAHQAKSLINKIEVLGGQAVVFPTIRITEPSDWTDCDKALSEINSYDWIVFSSINSVRYFMQRAGEKGIVHFDSNIAAIGERTVVEIKKYGLGVQLVPNRFTARELLNKFESISLKAQRILLPSSNIARDELYEGLKKLGAEVNRIVIYQTVPNTELDADDMIRKIQKEEIDCLTFFSPSAFNFFKDILGEEIIEKIKTKNIAVAAIGPTTARAIEAQGLRIDILPENSVEDNLIKAITNYYN